MTLRFSLGLLLLTACGTRALPVRPTPAITKVYVKFTQPKVALPTGGMMGDLMGLAGAMGGLDGLQTNYAQQLEARLRVVLAKTNIAIPVLDRTAADVVLDGSVRLDGKTMQWQLTEVSGQSVLMADSERSNGGKGAVDEYASLIASAMLKNDVDQYAGRGQLSGPTAQPSHIITNPKAPDAKTDGSQSFAVVIGVERYRDDLPTATHAEADARAFAAYAQRTLGVPESHIRVRLGQRAGRADLQSMIKEWLPRNATAPGGKVYVFFSGHGAPDVETGDAYLVPWDADPAFIKTRGISISSLYRHLEALQGQQVYVFLDACFSGTGPRSVIAKGSRPLVPVKAPSSGGRIIALTASAAKETTGAARDARHGLFTRHLLAGMGGAADADGDDNVSLAELADHVKVRVSKDARLDNREQTPSLIVADTVDPARHLLVEGLSTR